MKRRWIILMSLFVLGTVISPAQKVNLNFSQTNLRTVLESITRQTDYTLAFSKEAVDLNDPVTIRVTDTDLIQVLDQLFTSRNIGYELRDNKIYIFDKPTVAITQTQQPQPQEIRLNGRVTDENGDPVIGANISIPGTAIGTITDVDGNFSLSVPRGATLRVSYIGYLEQQFTITNQTMLDVQLQEDAEQLDELVVIGYGVQRKSVVTAAISRVTAEELNTNRPSRVEDALKGKVSGVQITQSSGQPGSDSKVRIRGIGTVNNSNPLYIVDGMQVGGGIDYLNPIDIQSVEILKDAASAAIYGTRAANGVILVTTKRGSGAGKPVVNYDMTYGWQRPWKLKDVLNATDYMVLMNENKINDGNAPIYSNEAIKNAGKGTNWQKETFNYDAPVQNHQVSVNGGNQHGSYFLSFGYFSQDGIVGGNYGVSNFERYSVRTNSNYQIFETKERSFLNKVRVGVNVGYSRTKSSGIEPNTEYGSVLGSALGFDPTVPVFADDATADKILADYPTAIVDKNGRVYSIPPAKFQELANPVAFLNRPRSERGNADKIVGTFFGEIDILPSLKFRSSYGVDLSFWGNDGHEFPYFLASQGKHITQSSVWSEMNRGYQWQVENYFTWTQKFADVHNVTAVLGQSAMKYTKRHLRGDDYDLLELDPNKANIDSAIGDRDKERVYGNTGGIDFESLASYFGRVDYNYAERYMVQFTLRRDGSSRFGPQNKWALFPAVSVGYNLMNEPFMEDVRPDWFDAFKLRFSYGRNGNENIGNLRYAAFIDSGQNYYFGGGYNVGTDSKSGTMQDGQSPAALPNAYLGWEKSEQTDIGFDAYFLRNRLTVGFDYFKKKTIGMLMDVPIPAYVGQGAPVGNVGTMENNGIEIELGWKHRVGDFNYFIGANASYMKNKLVRLGNESGEQVYENAAASGVGDFIKGQNGEVWPFFYGFKTDGLFQNRQEIDAYVNEEGEKMQPSALPGDVRFVDYNQDGIIDDNDRTKIGKGAPDWTFGMTLGAEYKNFDLNLFFQGVTGNDIFDFAVRGDIAPMNRPTWALERWHGEGTSNNIPRMTETNANANWRSSDLYIKDGSYLRLKTAQLGYTLPAEWTKKVSIQKLRMFVSGDNLLTFTKYQGYDPEIATGENYNRIGVDRGGYPQARTFSLGVNVSF